MQRYFYNEAVIPGKAIVLKEEDRHHLFNVMRSMEGDKFELVDITQTIYQFEIIDCHDKQNPQFKMVKEVDSFSMELPVAITIACGLSKNDKLDWLVQKATELGMASFQPLQLKRDVVQWPPNKSQQRLERLAKIAKSASEQSKRRLVPEILPLMNLDQWLNSNEPGKYDYLLYAYEETAKQGDQGYLKKVLEESRSGQKILVIFGSEGGLAEEEVEKLGSAGFIACSLGKRILRAETAPLYLLSATSYHYEL